MLLAALLFFSIVCGSQKKIFSMYVCEVHGVNNLCRLIEITIIEYLKVKLADLLG